MSHIDGSDDGVGYGVYGKRNSGNGVYGLSQSKDGYGVVGENTRQRRLWCVWQEQRRWCVR